MIEPDVSPRNRYYNAMGKSRAEVIADKTDELIKQYAHLFLVPILTQERSSKGGLFRKKKVSGGINDLLSKDLEFVLKKRGFNVMHESYSHSKFRFSWTRGIYKLTFAKDMIFIHNPNKSRQN